MSVEKKNMDSSSCYPCDDDLSNDDNENDDPDWNYERGFPVFSSDLNVDHKRRKKKKKNCFSSSKDMKRNSSSVTGKRKLRGLGSSFNSVYSNNNIMADATNIFIRKEEEKMIEKKLEIKKEQSKPSLDIEKNIIQPYSNSCDEEEEVDGIKKKTLEDHLIFNKFKELSYCIRMDNLFTPVLCRGGTMDYYQENISEGFVLDLGDSIEIDVIEKNANRISKINRSFQRACLSMNLSRPSMKKSQLRGLIFDLRASGLMD
jgi:hypothetical protein